MRYIEQNFSIVLIVFHVLKYNQMISSLVIKSISFPEKISRRIYRNKCAILLPFSGIKTAPENKNFLHSVEVELISSIVHDYFP